MREVISTDDFPEFQPRLPDVSTEDANDLSFDVLRKPVMLGIVRIGLHVVPRIEADVIYSGL